ncbi:Small subunit (SSU) processome component [Bonamia ostreae]|uniref:Small subunit (SSU) processome component n=1 Tax=Bonamia ostreae TaxID=126728 RepID=A0ABV2AH96_9EUKA
MRKLKHHEKKLLKKVNLYDWKSDDNVREVRILRRYRIQNREDYVSYNRLTGKIRKLSAKLKLLDETDIIRKKITKELLLKLYNLGVIKTIKSLEQCDRIPASAFCRRRLPVIMQMSKMAENLKEATTLVEQGHVRVGPNTIIDPAFLVTRTMEDYVTWVPGSKIKKHILEYNDNFDDFDFDQI